MPDARVSSEQRARQWDSLYGARGVEGVSWYQAVPKVSLELIEALRVPREAAMIDVGGGASLLVDRLFEQGFSDLTVLDVSASALEESRRRLGEDAPVCWLHEDLLAWQPARRYDLWHDRAVFHFLVAEEDRAVYLDALRSAIEPGGFVIVATFAPDGPEMCSGLPVIRYSSEDLALSLGGTFEPVVSTREEHTTPGGSLQPFTWLAGRIRQERRADDILPREIG